MPYTLWRAADEEDGPRQIGLDDVLRGGGVVPME
jgi:hypothetical protein